MTTLLVDGDILVYAAAFAAEEVHTFDDGETYTSTASMVNAKDHFLESLAKLADTASATVQVVALSDGENWRKALYPAYKAQRKKVRKPLLLKPLREWVNRHFTDPSNKRMVYQRPTLEADDVLGILATSKVFKGPKIVASIDKDLLQIPGVHLNITSLSVRAVSEEEGDHQHWMQTLTGDAVDNYPGLPGCGPVRASVILASYPPELGPWPAIVAAYEKKGLTEEDALLQARIARICRATEYNFKTKEVRLWNPPATT